MNSIVLYRNEKKPTFLRKNNIKQYDTVRDKDFRKVLVVNFVDGTEKRFLYDDYSLILFQH